MSELNEAEAALDGWISEWFEQWPAGYPSDESALTTLSYYYRLSGIAAYLRAMDEGAFVSNLHKAGQARLYYLRGCAAGQTGDETFFTTARNTAFLDALAIHDEATARTLAELCDRRWNPDLQYEDDHLWMQFLQTAFVAPDQEAPILERFAEVAQPDSPFLAVGDALHRRDAKEFDARIADLLMVRAENFASLRDPPDLPVAILATEPYLDVQGLALVRLARLRGMETAVEYPAIPGSLVEMAPGRHTFPPAQAWRTSARVSP